MVLAYVTGHYTAGSKRRHISYPPAFFGLYVAKEDPRLSFWTFSRETGTRLSFSVATTVHLNVERALLSAWLEDRIPLDQWRLYPVGPAEVGVIENLGLRRDYDEARHRLAAVLYMARRDLYFPLPDVPPLFEITRRSPKEIGGDVAERDEVMGAMGNL